jgi:hemolysin activation/secretion protein
MRIFTRFLCSVATFLPLLLKGQEGECEEPIKKIAPLCDEGNFLVQLEEEKTKLEQPPAPKPKKIVMLKGVLLVGNREGIVKEGLNDIDGVAYREITIPGLSCNLTQKILPFIGKKISRDLLIEIKKEILRFYRDQFRPIVVVEVPKQKLTGGVVQFVVLDGIINSIRFECNRWFPTRLIARDLNFLPGEIVRGDTIKNDLAWVNLNPFHHTNEKFLPVDPQRPEYVDLVLKTQDRFPVRPYFLVDNTGIITTGEERLSAGFSWGNAFNNNDILNYQYTTSNIFKRVSAHQAAYTSFLPWRDVLFLFGAYAEVKPQIPETHSTGRSTQFRLRYQMPFQPLFVQPREDVTVGLDFKAINSNIFFDQQTEIGSPLQFRKVDVSQLYFAYNYLFTDKENKAWARVEAFVSPAHILPNQSNADYNALRLFSKNRYAYGYLTLSKIHTFCNRWGIATLFRGQAATGTLPPTELFWVGGFNTVRGYRERELNSDNGAIFNFELRSPVMQTGLCCKDRLYLLGFVDVGMIHNYHPRITNEGLQERRVDYALGVGPGLRYLIPPYLSLRADYGFKLHQIRSVTPIEAQRRQGNGWFHFGLMCSY